MSAPDTTGGELREEECSALCARRECEWCPGHDRFEGVAQWLYKAVIARQDKIPSSDVRPWSDLTKDQRNGWRGWASELLALIDTPALPALRDLLAERDTLAAQVQAVEELLRFWDLADTPASVMEIDLRRALGTPTTEAGQ